MADELWAWVNPTPDGGASVIGLMLPDVGHVPLVFATERVARAALIRTAVRNHVDEHGQPARLVRFSQAEVLDEIRFERPA